MTVTIAQKFENPAYIFVKDMIVGHAYKDRDGDIFICNPVGGIAAFSICGNYIKYTNDTDKVVEVDLTITVD